MLPLDILIENYLLLGAGGISIVTVCGTLIYMVKNHSMSNSKETERKEQEQHEAMIKALENNTRALNGISGVLDKHTEAFLRVEKQMVSLDTKVDFIVKKDKSN